MNVPALIAFLVMDAFAFVACAKIAQAKARPGQAWLGLLGLIGVVIVAAETPAAGGGPEADDFSRLGWLRADGKPWTQRADWLASVAVAASAVVAFALYATGPKGELDGSSVAVSIETGLQQRLSAIGLDGASIVVTCPNAPMQSDHVFDCDMSGYPQGLYSHVRVTEDDTSGHFHYEAW